MADALRTTFLVKSGTKSKSYSVDFAFKDDRMFVFCDCPAGRFKKFCRHKIGLIQLDYGLLTDDLQVEELTKIDDWIQKSEFVDLIIERSPYRRELSEAQERLEAVKKKMRPTEKKMAQAMKDGIRLR